VRWVPTFTCRHSVTIRASQKRVWDVVVDPQMIPRMDPRISLVSMDGDPGTPGSSYVVDLRLVLRPMRVEYLVLDGVAPTHVRLEARQGTRWLGEQNGRLVRLDDASCLLQWELRQPAILGLGWLARRAVVRELKAWTTRVASTAEGHQPSR